MPVLYGSDIIYKVIIRPESRHCPPKTFALYYTPFLKLGKQKLQGEADTEIDIVCQ
jgi:hypothetical protein